jgi:hypothetical protein
MRRVVPVFFLLVSASAAWGAVLDPSLRGFMDSSDPRAERMAVIAVLDWEIPADVFAHADRPDRLQILRHAAEEAWQEVLADLPHLRSDTRARPELFWAAGSVALELTRAEARALAGHPRVRSLAQPPPVRMESSRDAEIPGYMQEIRMDQVLEEHPELTGSGTLLGNIDTGLSLEADSELVPRVALYYDAVADRLADPTQPSAVEPHGRNTLAIMIGGVPPQTIWGMAPGARSLVALGDSSLDGWRTHLLRAMQFMVDPDAWSPGAEPPRAVNCSWNTGDPNAQPFDPLYVRQEPYYRMLAAWQAANILPIFSGGNLDPLVSHPKEFPFAMAIGRYYTPFGPALFHKVRQNKPEIWAPEARCCGTSYSAPVVTGLTGLLWQADPELSSAQVRALLIQTASPPEGSPAGVWQKRAGYGEVDAYAAVAQALAVRDLRRGLAGSFISVSGWLRSPQDLATRRILEIREDLPGILSFLRGSGISRLRLQATQ